MYFFSLSSFVNNLKKKRYLYDNIVCDLKVLLENFYQNFYFELNVKLFCNFVELCTRSWTACRSQLVLYFTMHVYFSMHVKSRVWYRLVDHMFVIRHTWKKEHLKSAAFTPSSNVESLFDIRELTAFTKSPFEEVKMLSDIVCVEHGIYGWLKRIKTDCTMCQSCQKKVSLNCLFERCARKSFSSYVRHLSSLFSTFLAPLWVAHP